MSYRPGGARVVGIRPGAIKAGYDIVEARHWFLILSVSAALLVLLSLLTCRITGLPV